MSDAAFCEAVLHQHNAMRSKHGAVPLTLTPDLCHEATKHAKEMARNDKMSHSNSHYGENLYMMKSTKPVDDSTLAEMMMQSWYSEVNKHTFGAEPKGLASSHFSQVVWCDSTELGVGHAISKTGAHYVVCNYNPAGNFVGKYTKNVLAERQ